MEIKNVMMSIAGAVLLVLICWSWQNRKFSRIAEIIVDLVAGAVFLGVVCAAAWALANGGL